MKCTLCKTGDLQKGKTVVTLRRDSTVVVIEEVDALICDNCGHYYLDSATAKRTMHTLEAVSASRKQYSSKVEETTKFEPICEKAPSPSPRSSSS